MGVASYLGKGLREPVPPYRAAYFFGADLNSIDADGWDALPKIVDPTTNFDLSPITENHEVCVALINVSSSPGGRVYFNFKWYKDQPRTLLFEYNWSYNSAEGGWVYAYSYMGWTSWEIDEDGAYHVDISVSGAVSHSRTINFTISGILAEPVPPPTPVEPITAIIEHLNNVSSFFYSIYTETLSWIFPFWVVAIYFYGLSLLFNKLAWAFYYFNEWVTWVEENIGGAISWEVIKSKILEWFPGLEDAIEWFTDWWYWVRREVEDWWEATLGDVKDLIRAATEGFDGLIEAWDTFWNITWSAFLAQFETLRDSWDTFWTVTFPTLVSFTWLTTWWDSRLVEVNSLIDSTLKTWFPFYDDLVSLWEEIKAFFSDPLQWAYNKLDEFFARFW